MSNAMGSLPKPGKSATAAPGQAPAAQIVLAAGGQSRAVIVQPAGKLTSSEFVAVVDLRDYLGKIASATFPVVTEGDEPEGKVCIYVGRAAAKRLGIDTAAPAKDEWIIRTQGGHLYLTGGRWFGVEYASSHFLEDVLGVHWWTPWDETAPSMRRLTIDPLDLRGKPAFPISRRHDGKHLECHKFNSRNGANRKAFVDGEGNHLRDDSPQGFSHAHTLPELISWDEHGKEHPDWFAGKDDKVIGADGSGPVGHCFTHPDLATALADKICRKIRHETQAATAGPYIHPVPFIYHLSAGDHGRSCECPRCSALAEEEGSPAAALIQMLNRVAHRVRSEYPWAMIGTLAYQISREPPKSIRADEGVLVRFCTEPMNIAAPIDHPSNNTVREEFLGWKVRAEQLAIWSYESDFSPHFGLGDYGITWDLPIPNVHLIADRYRFWHKHGVLSIYQQTLGMDVIQADMRPLKVWLSLKLMENPDRDWRDLLHTFTDGFYGPAGRYIRRYLDLLYAAAREHPSSIGFFAGLDRYKYLRLGFLTEADALFDEAQAAVAADPVLSRRVRRARLGVDRSVMLLWPRLVAEWVAGGGDPESMLLSRQTAIRRYEQTFREQLAKRELPHDQWPYKTYDQQWGRFRAEHESRLRRTLAAVRDNVYISLPVPKRFAGRKVYDYPVGGVQHKFEAGKSIELVDDAQAANGRAIRVRGEGLKLPVEFGTAGRSLTLSTSIRPEDVPGPGYHWYCTGVVDFNYRIGAYLFNPSTVRSYAFEYGPREVWVSLKFEGPAFAFGVKDGSNTAWLERMILVEPQPDGA